MAVFSFEGSWRKGFLSDPDLPTLVVPEGKVRHVSLHAVGAGSAFTLKVDDPDIATVKRRHHAHGHRTDLEIHGHDLGETIISALSEDDYKPAAQLRVLVCHWRTILVNFYIVKDKGPPSSFNASMVRAQVDRLNAVYKPQACVQFHRHHVDPKLDLPDLNFAQHMTEHQVNEVFATLRDQVSAGQLGPFSLNVFCVRDWSGHDHGHYNAWATTHHNITIIDQQGLGDETPVLAHEAGHFFGLKHTADDGMLMRQGSAKGPHLNEEEVIRIRSYLQHSG